ncbi:MAG: tRNA uridine-5-carboxymethylaminomethyl(34) synthesis GTPase MnmE [Bacteroidales bacterium]|nr:tRNA uridine-5-carboxymethylaminomethyl(34) synthesis GTPase MnmE [Bacteroidales bacterium]
MNTICAIATPAGLGATAMIRISGPEAFGIAGMLFPGKSNFAGLGPNRAKFASLYDFSNEKQELIDQVVVTKFTTPHSFTGEDVVEISCHGSVYIQQKIIELLIKNGCRIAAPGEFTQRAFLNGKLDLPQAEAIADLIEAQSETAHHAAMRQLQGELSGKMAVLREELLQMASLLELELDFSEEEVEFADRTTLLNLLGLIKAEVNNLLQSYKWGTMLKNGIPVAIVGEPNVGKSTLLNAILQQERAIVSDIPGTTRDTIEDTFTLNGTLFRFIDTAGIRESGDAIERLGIERTLDTLRRAAIILWIFDARKTAQEVESEINKISNSVESNDKKIILIGNKNDLVDDKSEVIGKAIFISAKKGENLDSVLNEIDLFVKENHIRDITLLTSERHQALLNGILASIERTEIGLKRQLPTDLVAEDVRMALHDLGELTGTISSDDILNNIFGKFCIGK